MRERRSIFIFISLAYISGFWLLSCGSSGQKGDDYPADHTDQEITEDTEPLVPDYDTTNWTEIVAGDGYTLDIKYATTDNFVDEVIYPCGRMFLRPDVAVALQKVKMEFEKHGYGLILFDGYRPRPAQQKLWDKVPNPSYVAPPSEGSMHNRGVAIDLSLTDTSGQEINMGTPYDFFGPEAHHDFLDHPEEVITRRQLLKSVMESHRFQPIRTEWWHYSYIVSSYPLDDWQWPCLD